MFDPLSSPFESSSSASWSEEHTSNDPHGQRNLNSHPSTPTAKTPRSPLPPNPPTPGGREPQIYGEPGQGLIAPPVGVNGVGKHEEGGKGGRFLRVRVTALDRNRRDMIIRMDAQVCGLFSFSYGETLILIGIVIDKSTYVHRNVV